MKCGRCESVGKKPKEGTNKVIGPNGIKTQVCDDCLDEIDATTDIDFIMEINEDESNEEVS
jgi:hypothetical protein